MHISTVTSHDLADFNRGKFSESSLNIPAQLIRYARACFAYEDFSKRGKLLTNKMLQGYNESRLKSSFRKFYGRYNNLVCDYKLSLARMLNDLFHTIC